jgi:hypothetical protein
MGPKGGIQRRKAGQRKNGRGNGSMEEDKRRHPRMGRQQSRSAGEVLRGREFVYLGRTEGTFAGHASGYGNRDGDEDGDGAHGTVPVADIWQP